ncbi:hypothetical protein HELRODRAFT_181851 [Helobdella robusta]|uniref:Uncharacterized protein n=1 Tax=Helobdella robusta TaxID=6412 RepID=T1FHE3_HELRO|nr:hypothetical protein HELRODRAFT_181851 [Helobdella robusta]ESN92072.1 hypothetical protein HELRODRAFT_181851 [Helobdella robusta]
MSVLIPVVFGFVVMCGIGIPRTVVAFEPSTDQVETNSVVEEHAPPNNLIEKYRLLSDSPFEKSILDTVFGLSWYQKFYIFSSVRKFFKFSDIATHILSKRIDIVFQKLVDAVYFSSNNNINNNINNNNNYNDDKMSDNILLKPSINESIEDFKNETLPCQVCMVLKIIAPLKVLPKKTCKFFNFCITSDKATSAATDAVAATSAAIDAAAATSAATDAAAAATDAAAKDDSKIASDDENDSMFHNENKFIIKRIVTKKSNNNNNNNNNKNSAKSVLKIVHLADVHIEERYKEGTNVYCGLPVCCLEEWGKGPSGLFGDYRCNIPPRTFENFLEKVNGLNPDIIIFTGDVSPHTVWAETYESQMRCTNTTVNLLSKNLRGRNVYPVIGNHVFFAQLYRGFWITSTIHGRNWQILVEQIRLILNLVKDFYCGGYYSKMIHKNLKMITINGLYMYVHNYYNVWNHETLLLPPEVKKMKQFLEDELKDARRNKNKVLLTFHNPFGTSDYIVSESIYMESIIRQYHDVIVLNPIYDKAGVPVSVQLVSPSVSTSNYRNPTIRIYYLDSDSYQLLDYEQYLLNIMELKNLTMADVPNFNISNYIRLIYSCKSEYNMTDLSPVSWDSLIDRMNASKSLLLKYVNHYNVHVKNFTNVNRLDKRKHLCRVKNVHYDKYRNCVFDRDKWENPDFEIGIALTKRPPLMQPIVNTSDRVSGCCVVWMMMAVMSVLMMMW